MPCLTSIQFIDSTPAEWGSLSGEEMNLYSFFSIYDIELFFERILCSLHSRLHNFLTIRKSDSLKDVLPFRYMQVLWKKAAYAIEFCWKCHPGWFMVVIERKSWLGLRIWRFNSCLCDIKRFRKESPLIIWMFYSPAVIYGVFNGSYPKNETIFLQKTFNLISQV